MMNYLAEITAREMKKAMRRAEAFRALSEFIPRQTEGKWFTVADIRKEYPDASPSVLGYYLSHSWALGMSIKIKTVEIKCQPFTVEEYDGDICGFKEVTMDSYKANAYALKSSTY